MMNSALQAINRMASIGISVRTVRTLCFGLLMAGSVGAATDGSATTLQAVLQARFPQIQIDSVRAAPFMGLYEVLTPSEIVYSDAKGELLFVGKVIDAKSREDLTAKRWLETQRIDFASLPLDQAIKFVKGTGSRKLAVFADPQCPHCERFERVLENTKDITVYLFLLPIKEIHPNAEAVARNIWCSDDQAAAWTNWMLKKMPPPAATCANDPLTDIAALGDKLKVDGTPTIFFADGNRAPGGLNAEQLESALAERVAAH